MAVTGLDHVQLAIPPGGEERSRAFYVGVLGFEEVAKPDALRHRGGLWLKSGRVELHLGVEPEHTPARKAHPGLLTDDLDDLVSRCDRSGVAVTPAIPLPGRRRVYIADPFGNRIELLAVD